MHRKRDYAAVNPVKYNDVFSKSYFLDFLPKGPNPKDGYV